jgi:pimeloyl-ACP methyl ester carboxylesterase
MGNIMLGLNRRQLFGAGAAAGAALALKVPAARAAVPDMPFKPTPIPDWAPYKDGVAEVNGAKLYYRDSGGDGIPVVLMHPATGSALIWSYQQPAFVKAGYRVIAYSRRGYNGSAPADKNNGGVPSQDLAALMDFLKVGKFALVASAAGCTISLDFAIDHSDRVHAMAVAGGSYGETDEPEYKKVSRASRVKGFDDMPGYFRELGPAYRAADLEGTKAWDELEHKALSGNRHGPKNANKFNWTTLAKIKTPTLFIAGGSDLAAPPTMMRLVAEHVPGADMVVMHDVGHSTYWEQPAEFNKIVLDFFGKRIKT